MNTNNAILFTFGLILFGLAFTMPFVNSSLGESSSNYDVGYFTASNQAEQLPVTNPVLAPFDSEWQAVLVNIITIVFWTFGAPAWLNLTLFAVMRLIVIIIIWDKIRGI